MFTATKPFLSLTVAELMTETVLTLPENLSLQGAARSLSQAHISGAPVVDAAGHCVGVLSTTDFVPLAENERRSAARGQGTSAPFCEAWQIVEPEAQPADRVRNYMTADPVTVTAATPIRELARMMLDAHIHRVIVVNAEGCPIGIVSSTDVLAAVAHAEELDKTGIPEAWAGATLRLAPRKG